MKATAVKSGLDERKGNIMYYTYVYNMPKAKERVSMSVSLPAGLVAELDKMVEEHIFGSRSEALRYGAHLVVLFQNRVHSLAEEYAYQEIEAGLRRGKSGIS